MLERVGELPHPTAQQGAYLVLLYKREIASNTLYWNFWGPAKHNVSP